MTKNFNRGEKVEWNWGSGFAHGKVTQVYEVDVTKNIKGTEVTRNASADSPAYLIEQNDGDEILKSHSELRKIS